MTISRNELLLSLLPRVRGLVKQMMATHSGLHRLESDDCEQEAILGVIAAIDAGRYEPREGASFWSYVEPWARGRLSRLARQDRTIPIPEKRGKNNQYPAPCVVRLSLTVDVSLPEAIDDVDLEAVRTAVDALHTEYREAIKPFYGIGEPERSVAEIAESSGLKPGAVHMRVYRGKQYLRRSLRDHAA